MERVPYDYGTTPPRPWRVTEHAAGTWGTSVAPAPVYSQATIVDAAGKLVGQFSADDWTGPSQLSFQNAVRLIVDAVNTHK